MMPGFSRSAQRISPSSGQWTPVGEDGAALVVNCVFSEDPRLTPIVKFRADRDPSEWRKELAAQQPELRALLELSGEAQEEAGFRHTLAEICQQPATWIQTAQTLILMRRSLQSFLAGCRSFVLTGSGSSQYAGQCVHPALQAATGVSSCTLGAGWLLAQAQRSLPAERPLTLISLARSGDSPESGAVVEWLLETEPLVKHLVITCNARGQLATRYSADARVLVVCLDDRTNDRSLVMTSSFTNMAVAALGLGSLDDPTSYAQLTGTLAAAGELLLLHHTGVLATAARGPFHRAVFLASGCRFGAAREAGLKMLEMNAGRIPTMAETYLAFRHGPMSFLDRETLLTCFLASDPVVRAYEEDVITEINRKQLGARKLIVGAGVEPSLLADGDVAVDIPAMAELGDDSVAVLDVMVGQWLAFFRCRAEGLRPDMPSAGAISRVVNPFRIHTRKEKPKP
jgi:tagatose-6-phosphate ketose/aldose isomerase